MTAKRLPGEYLQRSLVVATMDGLSAALFAPEKLAKADANPGQKLRDGGIRIEEFCVVQTHRMDGEWDYKIATAGVGGQEIILPNQVIERIIEQRDRIIRQGREDRGRDSARLQAHRKQQRDTREDKDVAVQDGYNHEDDDLDTDPTWQELQE